jgi:hypothetical protein
LDIINPELNRDYNERVFSQNSLNRSVYLSILERVRESSDEELIKFYSGLIKLSQSRKFSPKNQQVLDVIEYMTVLKLISREHLNKSYIDSQNMWEIYKNKELGIELVYRKNHWN